MLSVIFIIYLQAKRLKGHLRCSEVTYKHIVMYNMLVDTKMIK